MPKSQIQLNFEQLWRVAHATEGGTFIPCGTKANAVRLRQQLYNAVHWVKNPKPGEAPDQELFEAAMGCELTLTGEDKATLHLRRKIDNPAMHTIVSIIGGNAKDPVREVLDAQAQRLMALQQSLDQGKEAPPERPAEDDPYSRAMARVKGKGTGDAK